MGFFSWDCNHCGHPMLAPHATEDKNEWMSQCVVITENGSIIRGEYDGYGRLDGQEFGYSPTSFHSVCWELAGNPLEYQGESKSSLDQGYFFPDNIHNLPNPKETGSLVIVIDEATVIHHEKDWREVIGQECKDLGRKVETGKLEIRGSDITLDGRPIKAIDRIVEGKVDLQDFTVKVNVEWGQKPERIYHDEVIRPLTNRFMYDSSKWSDTEWSLDASGCSLEEVQEMIENTHKYIEEGREEEREYIKESEISMFPVKVDISYHQKEQE